MSLNSVISDYLRNLKEPASVTDLARFLNQNARFFSEGSQPFTAPSVHAHVENFPSLFYILNGWVILRTDERWGILISTYIYIAAVLREFYRLPQLQVIVSTLYLYKRALDFFDDDPVLQKLGPSLHVPKNQFHWVAEFAELDRGNQLQIPLFRYVADLLEYLPPSIFEEILHALAAVDTLPFTRKELGIVFDEMIDIDSVAQQKQGGVIRTPRPTIDLMISLLGARRGTVLDPVCGVGGIITAIDNPHGDLRLTGFEIGLDIAYIAYAKSLLQSGIDADIRNIDCFSEINSPQRFDYIIADLPLAPMPKDEDFRYASRKLGLNFPIRGKGFSAFVAFIIAKLSDRGKAVLTVSEGFLSADGIDEDVRMMLINDDVLECVVSLPVNSLQPYTNGKSSLLVLNKKKPSYLLGQVKFIDAMEIKIRSKAIEFDVDKILRQYVERASDDNSVQIVSNEAIKRVKNLQVSFYLDKFHETGELLREHRAVELGQIVSIQRGRDLAAKDDANYSQGIPYVKVENLERDILDMNLVAASLTGYISNIGSYKKFTVSTEAILIARIGVNLKPTLFRPTQRLPEIVVHPNVLVLQKLSEGLDFNFEYLYYQIYSSFVQKQVERRRRGAVMPFINIKDLKSLVIPYMDIPAQLQFVSTQKSEIVASERYRVEQKLKLIGVQERDIQKESEFVSTLVHELRPKLVGMHTLTKKMERVIEKHEIGDLVEYDYLENHSRDPMLTGLVEPRENLSLQAVNSLVIKVAFELNCVMELVQQVMTFSLNKEDFARTNITEYIKIYFGSRLLQNENLYVSHVRGPELFVDINQQSFEHLLDQLVANAVKHGFKGNSSAGQIGISIREDRKRQVAIIEYSNNGLPYLLTNDDFIGFFQKSNDSSGSGIGGNFIYRIVKAHGGELSVSEGLKKGFNLKIEIPIAQGTNE